MYFGIRVTPHQLGLADVLATLELSDEQPGSAAVPGMVPNSLEMTLELSEPCRSRLEKLVQMAMEKSGDPGRAPKRRA